MAGQWRLGPRRTLTSFEEEDFVRESVNSMDLYSYLATERDRYWYAFIPYCFGTILGGGSTPRAVAPDPLPHDEPFAHLRWTRRVLGAVRAVLSRRGGARIG